MFRWLAAGAVAISIVVYKYGNNQKQRKLIGNTPLIKLEKLSRELSERVGYTIEIYGKCEFLNCGGSPKDRVAKEMLDGFERRGLLQYGSTIYEGTVGSTGIALAWQCKSRGYNCHICMPYDVAQEKVDLLLKLGAVVERVPPASIIDSQQYVNVARQRAFQDPHGVFADQFENMDNIKAHFEGTGPEIWQDIRPDYLVLGAGTGGTLVGCARYLKPRGVRVVLADPQGSGLYNKVKYNTMYTAQESEGRRKRHQTDTIVEGIGLTRMTQILSHAFDEQLIDDAFRVTDHEAVLMSRYLAQQEGLCLGSSSAVNVAASVKLALQQTRNSKIVTILCDSGARHLSRFWKDSSIQVDSIEFLSHK